MTLFFRVIPSVASPFTLSSRTAFACHPERQRGICTPSPVIPSEARDLQSGIRREGRGNAKRFLVASSSE